MNNVLVTFIVYIYSVFKETNKTREKPTVSYCKFIGSFRSIIRNYILKVSKEAEHFYKSLYTVYITVKGWLQFKTSAFIHGFCTFNE